LAALAVAEAEAEAAAEEAAQTCPSQSSRR